MGGPRTAHISLSGVAEQVIPEKSRLIELEVQYNGLYISGKTIATTKNVVYGERSSGAFD